MSTEPLELTREEWGKIFFIVRYYGEHIWRPGSNGMGISPGLPGGRRISTKTEMTRLQQALLDRAQAQ